MVAHDRDLRDAVALHEVDRAADLLLGLDQHEVGHGGLLLALEREHLLDRRGRRGPIDESMLAEPVVVVELREVATTRVGDQRDHCRLGPVPLRDLEGGPDRRAARAADEQALLTGEPPRGAERVTVRDRRILVDDRRVVGGRPEVLADPFDKVGMHVVRVRVDRAFGVGADHEEVRLSLAQVPRRAGDRPAGSDREDDHIELAPGLLPELGPGGLVVRLRVRLVRVLVRLVRARNLLGQAVRDRVVALGRIGLDRRRADDDLGAVRPEQGPLLLRDLVGHDEDAPVAADRGCDREPDARVPARRLDDRPSGPKPARPLGLLDHLEPDPILDASARVQVLELREDGRSVRGDEALQPNERCAADEVEDRGVLPRHARIMSGPGSYEPATQCRKWRRAVKTIAAPARSTASTTSESRFDPPGWMTAAIPSSSANLGPSANGKNASDASAAPGSSCPRSRAFWTASRTASTRLVWPPPAPRSWRSRARTIAFEPTCFAIRQPKTRSPQPASLGARVVTTFMPSRSSTSLSASWTRRPPSTRR